MPSETPKHLRPYLHLGIILSYGSQDSEAKGNCPWCGREEHLSVNIESGQYRCLVCDEHGNIYGFMKKLWKESMGCRDQSRYNDLYLDRGIAPDTLYTWGLCPSFITGEWLIPLFSDSQKIVNLFTWAPGRKVCGSPGLKVNYPFGLNLFDEKTSRVYLCEGVWDGMAWYETLSHVAMRGDRVVATNNPETSLLSDASVLCLPGVTSFKFEWLKYITGREVVCLFDNFHPRELPTGKIDQPTVTGMRKIIEIIDAITN